MKTSKLPLPPWADSRRDRVAFWWKRGAWGNGSREVSRHGGSRMMRAVFFAEARKARMVGLRLVCRSYLRDIAVSRFDDMTGGYGGQP